MTDQDSLFRNESGPLFLLTNRWNLLEILSSGLITPWEGYGKYYSDLLEHCPGRLALLRSPLPTGLVEHVTAEDPETAFPVALEFARHVALPEGTPTLDERLSAPAWTLTLQDVVAVHFRSAEELEEHRVREYENVVESPELRVTTELFAGSEPDDTAVSWLEGLPSAEFASDTYHRANRVSGALLMAAGLAPADRAVLAALAAAMSGAGRDPSAAAVGAARWIPHWTAGCTTPADTDGVLFHQACDRFLAVDPAVAWDPVAVLEEIRASVTKATQAESDPLNTALDRIDLILRNERDFQRFREGRGLDVAKALLLVLMRPEPERLSAWPPDETGATGVVRAVAGFLCGLLSGRKLLSSGARPVAFDRVLRAREAAAVNGGDVAIPTDAVEPEPGVVQLVARDEVLIEIRQPPPSLVELLNTVGVSDPAVRDVAVQLCLEQDWLDCLSTTIEVAGEFSITSGEHGKVRVTMPGHPAVSVSVDVDRLVDRLRDPKDGIGTESLTEALLKSRPPDATGSKRRSGAAARRRG